MPKRVTEMCDMRRMLIQIVDLRSTNQSKFSNGQCEGKRLIRLDSITLGHWSKCNLGCSPKSNGSEQSSDLNLQLLERWVI
jgi:hypothetical protein